MVVARRMPPPARLRLRHSQDITTPTLHAPVRTGQGLGQRNTSLEKTMKVHLAIVATTHLWRGFLLHGCCQRTPPYVFSTTSPTMPCRSIPSWHLPGPKTSIGSEHTNLRYFFPSSLLPAEHPTQACFESLVSIYEGNYQSRSWSMGIDLSSWSLPF